MIYADISLARKLERTEGRANLDFVETRAKLDPLYGAGWRQIGGAYVQYDGVESPLTQTFGLGMFEEATAGHLDEIESFLKERGARVFHEVSPLADQTILTLLGERGYRPIELTSVMFRDLSSTLASPLISNPHISTRQIDESDADLWAETSARGWATIHESLAEFMLAFGKVAARTPGGHPFLAEMNGEAVGAAGFGIYDDVCILAGAATVPEARNRGVQNALLDARLQRAKECDCSLAMICALPGSQSQKNAQKNGFNVAYTRIKWQLFE
ncbi:MAG TPA: GNAT family N-acetyltransferase [Pyrinomonadaceae bacterium]|nr:GNAT family N-acetyltransferase [Pyrinomonadaceae bacterium]